jgi:hypothetical protein
MPGKKLTIINDDSDDDSDDDYDEEDEYTVKPAKKSKDHYVFNCNGKLMPKTPETMNMDNLSEIFSRDINNIWYYSRTVNHEPVRLGRINSLKGTGTDEIELTFYKRDGHVLYNREQLWYKFSPKENCSLKGGRKKTQTKNKKKFRKTKRSKKNKRKTNKRRP